MQDKQLFEYAVIRVVPRVEREEFINVGVVIYCPRNKFLDVSVGFDADRLRVLDSEADVEEIGAHLESFRRICLGEAGAGPIARLDPASRFRWLTATRSTVIQSSKVHVGFSHSPSDALVALFSKFVG